MARRVIGRALVAMSTLACLVWIPAASAAQPALTIPKPGPLCISATDTGASWVLDSAQDPVSVGYLGGHEVRLHLSQIRQMQAQGQNTTPDGGQWQWLCAG